MRQYEDRTQARVSSAPESHLHTSYAVLGQFITSLEAQFPHLKSHGNRKYLPHRAVVDKGFSLYL